MDRHQIIAENCSLASSVSDNESKLEKMSLLTHRCPSLDSRVAIRFQRLDSDHIKSTLFQMPKFETTSTVYLRCSIAICYGRIENCQEVHRLFNYFSKVVFFLLINIAIMSRDTSIIISKS